MVFRLCPLPQLFSNNVKMPKRFVCHPLHSHCLSCFWPSNPLKKWMSSDNIPCVVCLWPASTGSFYLAVIPPTRIMPFSLQVHSLTGRDLPRTVRERLKQSQPPAPNPNVRIQDLDAQRKRPGFLSMLDDSYLKQTKDPIDPTMEKSKYRDTFDRVTSSYAGPPRDLNAPAPRMHQVSGSRSNMSSPPLHSMAAWNRFGSESQSIHQQIEQDTALGQHRQAPSHRRGFMASQNPPNTSHAEAAAPVQSSRFSGAKSKSSSEDSLEGPPKRNRKSTILARATFWDNRVHQGIASDKEVTSDFPGLDKR